MKLIAIVLGSLAAFAAMMVYAVVTNGYVLSQMWQWYMVPLGFARLGWQTFTVGMMALSIIRPPPKLDIKSMKRPEIVGLLAAPWFGLLIAWLIRQ